MTRTETSLLACAALAGLLIALAIPEPTMPQKGPPVRQERGEGFGSGNWTVAAQRSPARVYGASVVVVDGDSLRLNGSPVRLWGVDAPESAQTCTGADGRSWACGAASTASLRGMVERDPAVTCERRDTDRYGRMVAVCSNAAGDLGALQVARGLAVAYRRYSSVYVDHEAAAKAEKLGIWAGAFVPPEQYRRENRR